MKHKVLFQTIKNPSGLNPIYKKILTIKKQLTIKLNVYIFYVAGILFQLFIWDCMFVFCWNTLLYICKCILHLIDISTKIQGSYRVYRNPFFFFQFFVLFLCRYSPFQIFHLLHEYDYAILSDRLRKNSSDQFQVRLSSMMSYFTYEICQFLLYVQPKLQTLEQ